MKVWADDGHQPVLYEAEDYIQAAETYVATGDWGVAEMGHATIRVYTWWHGDDDGETCGGDDCIVEGHQSRDWLDIRTDEVADVALASEVGS